MVATPWGDSDSLRERQMHPVRGTPAADVRQSQRKRLFGAMVACVSEKGFAATTVANLVDVSGVSSRSFYDLFGDKSRCLRETVKAILSLAALEMETTDTDESLEEQTRRHYQTFARAVAMQPAAAKVCLTEAFAAGPEALEPIEKAVAAYERLLLARFEESAERAGMPREQVAARLGGVLEVARTRLRGGTVSELPLLGPDIATLLIADRPPPQPLRLANRPQKSGPEGLDAPNHAERAIRAFAVLVAERGYRATTVDDVVKRAKMTGRTFYANFRDKEDVMAAAIDSACAQAVAAVMPAFSRHSDWPDAVRGGLGALLGFLASRPALAQLVTVDVYAAGDWAVERRTQGVSSLAALLEMNTTDWQNMAPVVYEIIAGGSWHLLRETVLDSGTEALPALAPVLTYLTLSPFIGAEAACEAANGDGSVRSALASTSGRWSPSEGAGALPYRTPLRPSVMKALLVIEDRWASAEEIATEIGEDSEVVAEYMAELAELGAADVSESEGETPRYRRPQVVHKLTMVSTQQASTMSPGELDQLSRYVWGKVGAEVGRSLDSGLFDTRLDRYLTRTPLRVDKTGWRELTDLHEQTLHASIEIQARSNRRRADSEEKPIEARSVQLAFEVEPQDEPEPGGTDPSEPQQPGSRGGRGPRKQGGVPGSGGEA